MLSLACRGYFFIVFTGVIVQPGGARRASVAGTNIAGGPKGKEGNPNQEVKDSMARSSVFKSDDFDTMSTMSKVSGAASDVSFGRTPEQIVAICGEGFSKEVSWSMTQESEQCSCLCEFDECSVTSCPDGYDWESDECVKYETIPGDILPAKEEKLQCPGGSFTKSSGQYVCAIPVSCPEPPKTSGQGVFQSMTTDCGTCQYEVSCKEPAFIQMKESAAVCYTAEKKLPDTVERRTAEVLTNCPEGTENNEAGSCVRTVPCPTEVVLSNKALACGPQSTTYLAKLVDLMNSETEVLKKHAKDTKRLSCASSCYAMFAKFAECVSQDDAGQCAGRFGKSGRGARAIGALGHRDVSMQATSWLMKTKVQQKTEKKDDANPSGALPCKDMYGSDINFGNAWDASAKEFEQLANKHGILLAGSYMNKPEQALNCRTAFCEQVNKRSGKTGQERSLSQCLRTCEAY